MRLIDADKLLDELKWFESSVSEYKKEEVRSYIRRVEAAPTVGAVPVVHGRWDRRDDPEFLWGDFECSVCEYVECDVDTSCLMPGVNCLYYCRNCGAKMDGGAEDG